MKTGTKTRTAGKVAGIAVAAALMLSAIPAAGIMQAGAYGKSEETAKENDNVLTSNLIQDGSFEGVTVTDNKAGAWDIDVTSTAAGKGGSVAVVNDGYTGSNAFQLHAEGNKSGYPEISQKITVLPNTTYYVAMRVRCAYVNNIFFGLASAEREGETIYGQLHRWNDTAIDADHNAQEDAVTLTNPADATDSDEYSAYSLYNAHFTTGNETACRLFIRVEKSAIVIDDVSVTYEGNLLPAGSENLLRNGGFEDSSKADPLAGGWEKLADTAAAGSEIGIDPLDMAIFMRSTQDKQMEGVNTLYLAAKDGFTTDDNITIGQPVAVKADSFYTFSVNLSKYGDAKRAADEENNVTAQGIQRVTVGIYAADKETVLAKKVVDGSNISRARYAMFGVYANSGENTTVYPFVKFESANGGQWGNCLYVDDCLFYENKLDLPEGKINLFENGDFSAAEDGWYISNGWCNEDDQAYISHHNLGVNQWYPYVGLMQSAQLTAGKLYKVTAYVESWVDLPSPASILVIRGTDRATHKILGDGMNLWNGGYADQAMEKYGELEVVAKQSAFIESDMFYRPVNLIFSVDTTDTYTILVGFDEAAQKGDDGNLIFLGGINLGGISMYETSMEELSLTKETAPADVLGTVDTDNISFGNTSVTVSNGMPVSHFKENVYPYGNYSLKVVDANGAEVTTGNMQSGYKILVYVEGDEENAFEFAIEISDKSFGGGTTPPEEDGKKSSKGCGSSVITTVSSVLGMAAVAVLITAAVIVKKNKNGKTE